MVRPSCEHGLCHAQALSAKLRSTPSGWPEVRRHLSALGPVALVWGSARAKLGDGRPDNSYRPAGALARGIALLQPISQRQAVLTRACPRLPQPLLAPLRGRLHLAPLLLLAADLGGHLLECEALGKVAQV